MIVIQRLLVICMAALAVACPTSGRLVCVGDACAIGGQACAAHGECDTGFCNSASQCAPRGNVGTPCSENEACAEGLRCLEGSCSVQGPPPPTCPTCGANAHCNESDPTNPRCECDDGFSGDGQRCVAAVDPCASNPCAASAECVALGTQHACRCAPGYSGADCARPVSGCADNPCQNGGACQNITTGYACTCPAGYAGTNCEIPGASCEHGPCENDGVCMADGASFDCECSGGFAGTRCELPPAQDPCSAAPCKNGGTCSSMNGLYTCSCPSTFTGPTCETPIERCVSGLCLNGGSCSDTSTGPRCTCRSGFEGARCETNKNDCTETACANNGECIDGVNGFECNCAGTGYGGATCTDAINMCTVSSCKNGGTCVPSGESYTCACALGFSGADCAVNIDDCLNHACANGGTCIDGVNAYTCDCQSGFGGSRCETAIFGCADNPCLFGGTCVPVADGGYVCECQAGYEGQHCGIDINECERGLVSCGQHEQCVETSGPASCTCQDGFERINGVCTDIDECSSATPPSCHPRARCVNTAGSAHCECNVGYFGNGLNCADINECMGENALVCAENATCLNGPGYGFCNCDAGFTGDGSTACTNIDDCTPNPCNGGTCTDLVRNFSCTCPVGFAPPTCLVNTWCDSNPCENGGTCSPTSTGYRCVCATGFSGDNCEINKNECATPPYKQGGSVPCDNGGECIDGYGTYTCRCPEGYDGPTCAEGKTCSASDGCPEEFFCNASGRCQKDVCESSWRRCSGANVIECSEDGGEESLVLSCGASDFASTCIPDPDNASDAYCSCEAEWHCPQHTTCEAQQCAGTGQPPTCLLPPLPIDPARLVQEIRWGGNSPTDRSARDGSPQRTPSPFPNYNQVVMTPLVANLTDDNGDGLYDERDFPEIIFVAYDRQEYKVDGVLRAIHGGGKDKDGNDLKGKDYFASCGNQVWLRGAASNPANSACTSSLPIINSTAAIAVGDLDGDGVPEIVAVQEEISQISKRLLLYSNTGRLLATSGDGEDWNAAAPTIANLDNQGFAEVVVGRHVFTLKHDANGKLVFADIFRATQPFIGKQFLGPIACVADIVGNIGLEIIAGDAVYRLPSPPEGKTWRADCPGTLPDSYTAEEKAFCRGELVTVAGRSGSMEGYCAVADVLPAADANPGRNHPLDGKPEIILLTNSVVRLIDAATGVVRQTLSLGSGLDGGAPNVDDFDGDGFPEIGMAFGGEYYLLDLQEPVPGSCEAWGPDLTDDETPSIIRNPPADSCNQDQDCGDDNSPFACNEQTKRCVCLHNGWRRTTKDTSSRVTGSSVFDFNGDGEAEVAYNDECKFRIYNGRTGTVLFDAKSESRTRIEYPVIADIDNDGNAEIAFGTSNESDNCGDGTDRSLYDNGLEVWGDSSDTWVSARRIWNQHAYHVTNITEGGAIPTFEPKGWVNNNGRLYNSYRSNPRSLGIAPDAIVSRVFFSSVGGGCGQVDSEVQISARIGNVGDQRVGNLLVGFEGRSAGGSFAPLLDADGNPLTTRVRNTLEPSDSVLVSVVYSARDGQALPEVVRVTVDPNNEERECIEDNNSLERDLVLDTDAVSDLVVQITSNGTCAARPSVTITVQNIGTDDVAMTSVRFYAGDPAQGGAAVHNELIDETIVAGGAGVVRQVTLGSFPQCRDVTIYAEVDPGAFVNECNETNNQAYLGAPTHCCTSACGDQVKNGSEACDTRDFGNVSCQSLGFTAGMLTCTAQCQVDTSGCTRCPNGKREGEEQCDGGDLGGYECVDLGFAPGGQLSCTGTCQFDVSECNDAYCGDGIVNNQEQCDGTALNGATCAMLGYSGGTLACQSGCMFDPSGCSACNNGLVESGEECDGTVPSGMTCTSRSEDFDGGTLRCAADCSIDDSLCYGCGDGIRQGDEVCDGSDLNGKTCEDIGLMGNRLRCKADCTGYDSSECATCETCVDCAEGQACVGGQCGTCASDSDCCGGLVCFFGQCRTF